MLSNDIINAGFEAVGTAMLVGNCRAVYRDRAVKGVSIGATTFFAGWGFWNLLFYSSLHQWLSFVAACCLTGTNVLWVILMWRYRSPKENA